MLYFILTKMPPKKQNPKRVQSETAVVGFGQLDPKYDEWFKHSDFIFKFVSDSRILLSTDIYS